MGPGAILAVISIIVAVAAVYVGHGGSVPGFPGGSSGGNREFLGGERTVTKTIADPEKKPFFEDKEVRKAPASHGYAVEVKMAGSRRVAADVNLDSFDMAFLSPAPVVEKIAEKMSGTERYDVFYTPITTTTFDNILQALEWENIAQRQGIMWRIDMAALATMQHDSVRWRDFAENDYPLPCTMQVSTTDIRSPNSAAMYLSLISWTTNEDRIASDSGQANAVLPGLTPLSTGQGYMESSSAGPSLSCLLQNVGSKPTVMVYESQFLGEGDTQNSRLEPEIRLAYPSSAIPNTHVALGFNDNGATVARLLTEDPELQELAAEYDYRSSQPEAVEEFQTQLKTGQKISTDFVDPIDLPSFDTFEQFIEGVSRGYQGPPRPKTEEG